MNQIENYNHTTFEQIKHVDSNGVEFWYARELMPVLEYDRWENFYNAIGRAFNACKNSNINTLEHFREVTKLLNLQSGGVREISDYALTRYACYLIVMNGDPKKEIIAAGQTYFAVKARQQELSENFNQLSENQKRLAVRAELTEHNKSLAEAANMAGVKTTKEYAVFQNKGYQGLYGGLGVKQIRERKGLKDNQAILDHMGSTELAANLFRATQTDEKLRRDKVQGVENANNTHFQVGRKVRQTIQELGGTMPEDLPTPNKSIKQLEKEEKKKLSE